MPGTHTPPVQSPPRERVVPILEESGLAAGRDFHVAFSPERVDHDTVLTLARLVVDLRGITRGTRVENVMRL